MKEHMHSQEMDGQSYMEKLFPEGPFVPAGALSLCLVGRVGRTDVVLLLKEAGWRGSGAAAADALMAEADISVSRSSVGTEESPADTAGSPGLLLQLELPHHPDARETGYRLYIPGSEPERMAEVALALLRNDRIAVFLADENFRFAGFHTYAWHGGTEPGVRTMLLQTASYTGTGSGE